MADNPAMSNNVLNFSGMLFNKGNTRTPFSTAIGAKQVNTNHCEFATGQEYNAGGAGSQPAISESASLTAPEAKAVTREQKTNVTQIFHEKVSVSYGKQSNMGTLSGINIANQQANPINELDFQTAAAMKKIARDIEYTFINGVYHKATSDTDANKTRGLISACTTNVIDMGSKPLGIWTVAEAMKSVYESNGDTSGLVVWCDAVTLFQLNADAVQNGLTVVTATRNVNGIMLSEVVTPLGKVYLQLGECLPAGTGLLLNLDVIRPVGQPVPNKGNFFREMLAKTGAGESHQIFGQMGLDHGPEWYHGKFTNISTSFETPKYSRSVFVSNIADIGSGATAASEGADE